ncbi:hypothetical protein LY78DRAFT_119377 [Colletotrichum sublineola]|nr:hypothetical protein LY78DRAFT_119377 [Colletotrichum sublineola]
MRPRDIVTFCQDHVPKTWLSSPTCCPPVGNSNAPTCTCDQTRHLISPTAAIHSPRRGRPLCRRASHQLYVMTAQSPDPVFPRPQQSPPLQQHLSEPPKPRIRLCGELRVHPSSPAGPFPTCVCLSAPSRRSTPITTSYLLGLPCTTTHSDPWRNEAKHLQPPISHAAAWALGVARQPSSLSPSSSTPA